ncbi:MAG: zf-HC2 domain-containing protein, partial [Candidatus Acidiferrales bacterium]
MDCSQVAELAPLYLSGELDRERAGAVDAHLRFCASCMGEIESQARLDARMREVIGERLTNPILSGAREYRKVTPWQGAEGRRGRCTEHGLYGAGGR